MSNPRGGCARGVERSVLRHRVLRAELQRQSVVELENHPAGDRVLEAGRVGGMSAGRIGLPRSKQNYEAGGFRWRQPGRFSAYSFKPALRRPSK
jgi:hypothetical protein